MKKLYIIGAGSVGGHIALNIDEYNENYKIEGFFDDDPKKSESLQFGYPVLGDVEKAIDLKEANVVIGIAFPSVKEKIVKKLISNQSLIFPSFVHSRAWLSNKVTLGKGAVVYPGCSVNYGCEIGNFVIMNMNCALGHHTKVGHYSSLAPSVSTGGHTTIGNRVDVGIGASTIQNVTIGEDCIIGGKSMVVSDVKPNLTVKGVPAR